MWKPTPCNLRPTGESCRRDGGAMAHRRGLFRRSTATAAPLLLLGGLLLAGAVFVSNQVVALRVQVDDLQDRREFMEARQARLRSQWNTMTAADVVVARAERELGLIRPAEPGLVLVQVPQSGGKGDRRWDRFLAQLGGGTPVQAADHPGTSPDRMVSLLPRPADPVLPESWGAR